MQGIGDLPVELLIIILDQISRNDTLNLRLCAPRNILPLIDTIVFRKNFLQINISDDLRGWKSVDQKSQKEGVVLQRLVDVSQSRIVKHVRVLVLRIARPSLSIFLFVFFCYPAYWCIRRQETHRAEKGSTITAHHSQ